MCFWLPFKFGWANISALICPNRFVVEGVRVGLEKIRNERLRSLVYTLALWSTVLVCTPWFQLACLFRSVLGNLLVGGARSYPKFVFALLAYFVAFSDIGLAAVLGSIGFTIHVVVGLALLNFKRHFGSQKEVFLLLQYRNIKFMKYQIEGSPQLPPYADHLWLWLVDSHWGQSLHIGCSKIDPILWLHPPVFRHLPTAPLLQDGGGWGGGPAHARAGEEADARWADWFTWQQFFIFVQESSWHPQVVLTCWNSSRRLSYRSRGSSLLCLISWCEYVATLATAILPSLSMFCCDPVTRLGTMRLPETCFQTFCFRPNTGLWPLAVVGGSIWVPCGSSFILHNPITMMFCSQNSYTFKSYITGRRNKLASSKLR